MNLQSYNSWIYKNNIYYKYLIYSVLLLAWFTYVIFVIGSENGFEKCRISRFYTPFDSLYNSKQKPFSEAKNALLPY